MNHSRHPNRFNPRDPEATPRPSRPRQYARCASDAWFAVPIGQTSRAMLKMPLHRPSREKPNVSRLVPSDPSARAELFAYGSLGIAAGIAVVFALAATFSFAHDLDRIVNWPKAIPATVSGTIRTACESDSLTNIAGTRLRLPASNETRPAADESTVRSKTILPTG